MSTRSSIRRFLAAAIISLVIGAILQAGALAHAVPVEVPQPAPIDTPGPILTPARTPLVMEARARFAVLPSGAAAAGARPQDGWVTLMSEGFEGEFPAPGWHIGREGDPYLWGVRNCHAHTGGNSIGGGYGGPQGSQIACDQPYTANYVTTLSYGPLDLSDCNDLRLNFSHLTDLAPKDSLSYGYSNDGGKSWMLRFLYGDYITPCEGWCEWTIYANQFAIPLCGKSQVYLLFRFQSDLTETKWPGAWVDDVSLEAYYGQPSPTPTPRGTIIPTTTPTPTRTTTPGASRRAYLPLLLK